MSLGLFEVREVRIKRLLRCTFLLSNQNGVPRGRAMQRTVMILCALCRYDLKLMFEYLYHIIWTHRKFSIPVGSHGFTSILMYITFSTYIT